MKKPKCDYCEKESKYNYQKDWNKYLITDSGNYVQCTGFSLEHELPEGEENLHLCETHARIFEKEFFRGLEKCSK